MKKINLKAKDGYVLSMHIFEVENPKGYVQVIHGMEEHQKRYEELAGVLNKEGYTVITSDMRGHGPGAPMLGYFKEKDGYKYLLSDQRKITSYIMKHYKTENVIIFAHSMGTIIARNLLRTESMNYEKVILSGYPQINYFSCAAVALSDLIKAVKGPEYCSKFLAKNTTGVFNKSVKNPRTDYDWLSMNEKNVNDYIASKFCGHGFKTAAYNDLYHLTWDMSFAANYRAVNNDLPILTLRGELDPCTGYAQGSRRSRKVLADAGFNNICDIAYVNMRHEILNEEGKEKVFADIVKFLKNN